MDSKHLYVSEADIDHEHKIQNTHLYFVYNLDEVVVQDFQDAPQEYILMKKNYNKVAAYYQEYILMRKIQ